VSVTAKPLVLDTERGGSGPLAPPAHWFGTEDDYRALIRHRYRRDPGARQQIVIAARNCLADRGLELTTFTGPFAEWAANIIAAVAANLVEKAKQLH